VRASGGAGRERGGAGRERGGAARARAGAAEVFRPQERQRGLTPRSGSAEHQRGSAGTRCFRSVFFCSVFQLLTNEITLVCLGQGCKLGSDWSFI
jgi:hypothetical protein